MVSFIHPGTQHPTLGSACYLKQLRMTSRPLRFCIITTFYPPYNFGGDGIFVHQLSNELAHRGHQVEVIHCIDSYRLLAREELSVTYHDHPNVTVHGLRSPFGFLSPLATHQTGLPLFKSARIRQILKKGFDVIHYHNISLVGGPKILEYGEGIKLYTMHEYWLVCPTHVLFRFNRTICTRPYCFLCGLTYKRPPQWWRHSGLLKTMVKHIDTFIAPGYFSKKKHLEMGLNVPIVHLPNFIPAIDETGPIPNNATAPKEPYFLFVGRLEKLKGLQTLIPVFRHYPKAQLVIVGIGSYQSHLQKLAKGYSNISFLGYISPTQLQSLYSKAVALIVPSLCFENFPLVMIEAFRQQTPVIVRNLGGTPEIIEKSGNGLVYETEEELLAEMNRLLANPSYRQELGLSGYQAYKKNWTTEAHLKRYFELIDAIKTTMKR